MLRSWIHQMYILGVQSLPILVLSLTVISIMMVLEFSFHMKLVLRQDSLVPAFSTLLMIRELAPVVTSLLLASRVGAGIAAEVGTMRISEQLDALRLLGIDLKRFIVLPRLFASIFAAVTLTVVSIGVSFVAGSQMASIKLGFSLPEYFNSMLLFVHAADFGGGVLKAAIFGTIIGLVGLREGFICEGGAQGVGRAATRAVIHASLLIIIGDFVLTSWLS